MGAGILHREKFIIPSNQTYSFAFDNHQLWFALFQSLPGLILIRKDSEPLHTN